MAVARVLFRATDIVLKMVTGDCIWTPFRKRVDHEKVIDIIRSLLFSSRYIRTYINVPVVLYNCFEIKSMTSHQVAYDDALFLECYYNCIALLPRTYRCSEMAAGDLRKVASPQ